NVARLSSARGLKLILANGRISDRSFPRYRAMRGIVRSVLQKYDRILAREETDRERFVAIGAVPETVEVSGNVKFDFEPDDAPLEIADRLQQLAGVLPAPGYWVDVGCSNGAMLALLRRRGWVVTGVEADPAACAEVTSLTGLSVIPFSQWQPLAASRLEATATSLYDVLEHCVDPVGVLKAASRSLRPDGVLIVEVPDFDTAPDDFKTWKHRRVARSFTEHVWHFSERSLDCLRARHLSDLVPARVARPVAGRLQVVWRKAPKPPDQPVLRAAPGAPKSNTSAGRVVPQVVQPDAIAAAS
ncbi:MAG TPA: methyltransferase domain-containing protein, partial [Gemmataceae bacterium]|nr:methyltransferase domain-containing protein [Gemmataceae bacterium]